MLSTLPPLVICLDFLFILSVLEIWHRRSIWFWLGCLERNKCTGIALLLDCYFWWMVGAKWGEVRFSIHTDRLSAVNRQDCFLGKPRWSTSTGFPTDLPRGQLKSHSCLALSKNSDGGVHTSTSRIIQLFVMLFQVLCFRAKNNALQNDGGSKEELINFSITQGLHLGIFLLRTHCHMISQVRPTVTSKQGKLKFSPRMNGYISELVQHYRLQCHLKSRAREPHSSTLLAQSLFVNLRCRGWMQYPNDWYISSDMWHEKLVDPNKNMPPRTEHSNLSGMTYVVTAELEIYPIHLYFSTNVI